MENTYISGGKPLIIADIIWDSNNSNGEDQKARNRALL